MHTNDTRLTDEEVQRRVAAALGGDEGPAPQERRSTTVEVHQHMSVAQPRAPAAWVPAAVAVGAAVVAVTAALVAILGGRP